VKFWDTSALVPLFIHEPTTDSLRRAIADDPDVVIWAFTEVELASAIWRRQAEPSVSRAELARQAAASALNWDAVVVFPQVMAHALSACERHRLRSADALQLGAALVACNGAPSDLPFVTLDHDLASAARAEGFPVLP
jgi:predicted nucleic acid-binding protein